VANGFYPFDLEASREVEASMCRALILQVLQIFVTLVISALYAGVWRRVEAVVVSTPGPAGAHLYPEWWNWFCTVACYLAGGALMLALASFGISSSGLDAASRLSGATGAAAIRITDYLNRDLTITQGKGSVIYTWRSPRGRVALGGRAIHEGRLRIR
jgi:hypothetical protein